LQGLTLSVQKLSYEIAKQREEQAAASERSDLPEWLNLEQVAALKGGGALSTYRQKLFLQPCCGKNQRLVCGRRCWNRKDVIEWLAITDDKGLVEYAQRWGVALPETYLKRGE
jgi:hypothetical protein